MSNKTLEEQLHKIENADMRNYNKDTNTYLIPRKQDIKVVEDCCYLLRLKPSAFSNSIIMTNWNSGRVPKETYYRAEINKKMSNMINIVGVAYDITEEKDLNSFWSGWLSLGDVEILKKL